MGVFKAMSASKASNKLPPLEKTSAIDSTDNEKIKKKKKKHKKHKKHKHKSNNKHTERERDSEITSESDGTLHTQVLTDVNEEGPERRKNDRNRRRGDRHRSSSSRHLSRAPSPDSGRREADVDVDVEIFDMEDHSDSSQDTAGEIKVRHHDRSKSSRRGKGKRDQRRHSRGESRDRGRGDDSKHDMNNHTGIGLPFLGEGINNLSQLVSVLEEMEFVDENPMYGGGMSGSGDGIRETIISPTPGKDKSTT